MKDEQSVPSEQVERLIADLESALARGDVEGVVAAFLPDATIESPMIARLSKRKDGICRGHDEIRELGRAFQRRGKPWGAHRPPLVRGNTVAIEYLQAGAEGAPFSVDIIELRDGKIASLRAYAGWRALARDDEGP